MHKPLQRSLRMSCCFDIKRKRQSKIPRNFSFYILFLCVLSLSIRVHASQCCSSMRKNRQTCERPCHQKEFVKSAGGFERYARKISLHVVPPYIYSIISS